MEFVVEPVVSELFKRLLKILGSNEVRDFAWQLFRGDSELKELNKKLRMVQKLLRKVEDKQLTDEDVKEWLDDLQHWAYDAEDLLDEIAYQASRRKLKAKHQASSSKGMSFLPASFPSPLINLQIGSKIKDITRRLEQLRQERSAEHEMQVVSGGTSSNVAAPQRPEETSSVPPENEVYGRVEDEAKLLDMVKSAQPSGANFRVIAIVGMGGIGKTTIARKIYNHMQLGEDLKFEKKGWACVSNNFDVLTISKALLKSKSLNDSSSSIPDDKNNVQVELQKAVNGKKFLIVFDDVWEIDYRKWEQLMSPFKAGAPGSTMIVTTRHRYVAQTIRCPDSDTYPLQSLSDEACWSLFQEHALATSTAAANDLITDSIRERVLKRCSGLPLAAKTLGGLLHSKPINTWERIVDSEIWNSFKEKDVLPVLKLSYLYLPSHLKRCFEYCAIFPKDYEFEKNELVLLWMAEGIVQSSDAQLNVTSQYFNDLCLRSLFQKSNNDDSMYVMHDLVHDLAESIFKEFSFRSEQDSIELPENIKKLRHFSYISDEVDGENKFKGLKKFKSLRTFLAVFTNSHDYYYHYCIIATGLFYLLSKLKKLRVLSLKRYHITHLPDSIGDLIHLRYLNFSETRIRSLPESTSQLFNLQTLLLKDCYCLVKLPFNMRYLTNLYHLDISGRNSLKKMPLGMKELKNLRVLSNFIVGKEPNSNLEDLKSLNFLQGELYISKLENVTDPKQIGGQILSNKNNLKVLLLEWGDELIGDSQKEDVEMHVLDKLKPPSSLAKLTIRCYGGQSFPSYWFKDPASVSNLVVLKLENCKKCKSLPSLEMLSSLKDLTIQGMTSLKIIDFQMPLKSLEVLRFENLQEWEHWDTWGGNEDVETFAQLHELWIERCPKVTREFPNHLPSLKRFVVWGCSKLVVSISSLPKGCKVDIDSSNGVVCNDSSINFESLHSQRLPNILEVESKLKQGSQRVESLWIDGSDEIMDSWQNLPDIERSSIHGGMHGLSFLKQLHIHNCKTYFVFFENTKFLPNLSGLTFNTCQTLVSLPGGLKEKNLKTLAISECHSLRSIDCSMLPSSLKKLEINCCEKLEFLKDLSTSLLDYLIIQQCHSLTCTSPCELPETLQVLHISYCYELKTLSRCQYLPETLTSLSIQRCRKLKLIDGSFEKSMCLQNILLIDCENLESIPIGLQKLSRVNSLRIVECPKLLVREGVPTSLIELYFVGGLKFDKPLMEWELQNLRDFYICNCEDVTSIFQEGNGMLTSLTTLTIVKCPRIESIPNLTSLTSLTKFTIKDCPRIKSIPNLTSLTSLTEFTIEKCLMLESIHNLTSLTSLTELTIKECPVESIPNLTSLTSLRILVIKECPKLKSIHNLTSLTSLTELTIKECPRIESIPNLTSLASLTELTIDECPMLKSIPNLSSLTSLRFLLISECERLKSIPALGSLEHLGIMDCPKLKSLQSLPSSLLYLSVEDCPLLTKQWNRGKKRYCSKIAHIPKVQIDGKFIFNSKEEESDESSD